MNDAQLRELDKTDILGAAIWPLWPWLPLKHKVRKSETGFPEVATLFDAYSKIAQNKPEKLTVYKMGYDNIGALNGKPEEERKGILEKVTVFYDSIDALLDDGWTVD